MRKGLLATLILILTGAFLYGGLAGYKLYKWNALTWFSDNLSSLAFPGQWEKSPDGRHLVVLLVDHHEPGTGERGVRNEADWCEAYRKTSAAALRDSYSNSFKYTWFFPVDQFEGGSILELNKLVYDGLGEIELHWHHELFEDEPFRDALSSILKQYGRYGAMVNSPGGPAHFGYIAGNWNLDNAVSPGETGPSNQIDTLQSLGCYADFTFCTIGTLAQPKTVNSIYFVKDSPARKSYDVGVPARAGDANDGFLLLEGPLFFDWQHCRLEYAALEIGQEYSFDRVKKWIDYAPIVQGVPQWRFLKIYTHGQQSKQGLVLEDGLGKVLQQLKSYADEHEIKLHFASAREAYNMVMAAVAGKTGNPEEYRDFKIPQPLNKQQLVTGPLQ